MFGPSPTPSALALVAGPALSAAVPPERLHELVHHPHHVVAIAAAWGLARRAVFEGRYAVIEPLLDLPSDKLDQLNAAFFAAEALDERRLVPKLRERLAQAQDVVEAITLLQTLEQLGDSEARAAIPADLRPEVERGELQDEALALTVGEAPAHEIASAVSAAAATNHAALCDRTSGQLHQLLLLSELLGEGLLPHDLVEAVRRRDPDAVAARLRALSAVDPHTAPLPFRHEARARLLAAEASAQQLLSARPRKEEFDALAVGALVHVVAARAMVQADPHAALALAFLEGREPWRLCRTAEAAKVLPLLERIAQVGGERAAMVVVESALAWKLDALAPQVVRLVAERSLSWVVVHSLLATRLERALLAALPPGEELEQGQVALLSQLVSTEAEARAVAALRNERLSVRAIAAVLLHVFPTPAVQQAFARAPAFGRDELQERLETLAELAPVTVPAPEQPVLHCQHCGHAWPLDGVRVIAVGDVELPDPAPACPACKTVGDVRAYGAPPAETLPPLSSIGPFETPRIALERLLQQDPVDPVELLQLADLAGDAERGEQALQQLPREAQVQAAPVVVRALERRGRTRDVLQLAQQALAEDGDTVIWSDEEEAGLRDALERACRALDLPLPERPKRREFVPTPPAQRAEAKVGRNEPCPCGSGKKFKKCHGA